MHNYASMKINGVSLVHYSIVVHVLTIINALVCRIRYLPRVDKGGSVELAVIALCVSDVTSYDYLHY